MGRQEAKEMDSDALHELFAKRYPDLAFLLHLTGESPITDQEIEEERDREEMRTLLAPFIDLKESPMKREDFEKKPPERNEHGEEEIEVLYLYGVGNGYAYPLLHSWLKRDRRRELVFIEEELAPLFQLLYGGEQASFITDPQVHIAYRAQGVDLFSFLESLVQRFPVKRIFFATSPAYKRQKGKEAEAVEKLLLERHLIAYAHMAESLRHHDLFKNLLPNYLRLPSSSMVEEWKGCLEGVPALICGAGPSLDASMPLIKEHESRALVIAGGSTIAALGAGEITPHLGVAIDPNQEEYERLRHHTAFSMPLLYASRVISSLFHTTSAPLGYINTLTGGASEKWLLKELGMGKSPSIEALGEGIDIEALSVTTSCIALAVYMGCSPIILVGLDLAFQEGVSYASGVESNHTISHAKNRGIIREPLDGIGPPVLTQVKWEMEAKWISHFAKSHPQTRFINSTEGGIGFEGIERMPLDTALDEQKEWDLTSLLHLELMTHPAPFSRDVLMPPLQKLHGSLHRCKGVIQGIVDLYKEQDAPNSLLDSPYLIVPKMELEEEIAYSLFLQELPRSIFFLLRGREREGRPLGLLELEMWQCLMKIVESYLETFALEGIPS